MNVLVNFRKDWADEFDVVGWRLFDSVQQWEDHRAQIGEYYFGTNEGWDGSEFNDSDFRVSVIDMDQAQALTELFGSEWGHFPS